MSKTIAESKDEIARLCQGELGSVLDFVTLREAIDTAMEKTCTERAGFAVPLRIIRRNLSWCLTS